MPEGPEVETTRTSLLPALLGRVVLGAWISGKRMRAPLRCAQLQPLVGRAVVALGRRGKALWIDVEGGAGVLVRLGMTGRLVVEAGEARRAPHTHVALALMGGHELRFVDARRFGSVVPYRAPAARDALLADVGPDVLTLDDAGRRAVVDALRATERTLKDALLDQRLLAGVGNIYASEALFRARLSPYLRGRQLGAAAAARLVAAAEATLADAVRHRGTSFSDYVDGRGEQGDNLAYLYVFAREGEPCRVCGAAVRRRTQGQRSTYLCPACQPRAPRLR